MNPPVIIFSWWWYSTSETTTYMNFTIFLLFLQTKTNTWYFCIIFETLIYDVFRYTRNVIITRMAYFSCYSFFLTKGQKFSSILSLLAKHVNKCTQIMMMSPGILLRITRVKSLSSPINTLYLLDRVVLIRQHLIKQYIALAGKYVSLHHHVAHFPPSITRG